MIKETEIRINNIVLWNGQMCTIKGISYFIDCDNNKEGYIIDLYKNGELIQTPYLEDVDSVKLTSEILNKCDIELGGLLGDILGNLLSDEERSLHWLQNTYFQFKGEELKINL